MNSRGRIVGNLHTAGFSATWIISRLSCPNLGWMNVLNYWQRARFQGNENKCKTQTTDTWTAGRPHRLKAIASEGVRPRWMRLKPPQQFVQISRQVFFNSDTARGRFLRLDQFNAGLASPLRDLFLFRPHPVVCECFTILRRHRSRSLRRKDP